MFSKNEGRIGSSGSSPTSTQGGTPQVVASGLSFGQDPNHFINSDGRLIGDRPVVTLEMATELRGLIKTIR